MLEFLLTSFNLMKDEWFIDKNSLEIYEYNREVMTIRVIFFGVLYILLIPFLLQDKLDKLKPIAYFFLFVLFFVCFDLMIEGPFFRNYYNKQQHSDPPRPFHMELFKDFSLDWIPIFFSMMLSFYVQPFVLTFRNELLAPC